VFPGQISGPPAFADVAIKCRNLKAIPGLKENLQSEAGEW
jgi:hypothetical protein